MIALSACLSSLPKRNAQGFIGLLLWCQPLAVKLIVTAATRAFVNKSALDNYRTFWTRKYFFNMRIRHTRGGQWWWWLCSISYACDEELNLKYLSLVQCYKSPIAWETSPWPLLSVQQMCWNGCFRCAWIISQILQYQVPRITASSESI